MVLSKENDRLGRKSNMSNPFIYVLFYSIDRAKLATSIWLLSQANIYNSKFLERVYIEILLYISKQNVSYKRNDNNKEPSM